VGKLVAFGQDWRLSEYPVWSLQMVTEVSQVKKTESSQQRRSALTWKENATECAGCHSQQHQIY
jgi:hypothetical protein